MPPSTRQQGLGTLKEQATLITHTGFPGAQLGVMCCSGRPRGTKTLWVPCLIPFGESGVHRLAEALGNAHSASELCLICLVCPSSADTFFPKGFGKCLAKIVVGMGVSQRGGGTEL